MKFTTTLYPTPDNYDSDDIRWETEDGKILGYGYMSKDKDRTIHIKRCPQCDNENYMAQPICINCGFEPNPDVVQKKATEPTN